MAAEHPYEPPGSRLALDGEERVVPPGLVLRSPASRAIDLLLAVPVAAYVPALGLLAVATTPSRGALADWLYLPLPAFFFAMYFMPFVLFAAVPCYFAFRALGQLGPVQCALTGAVVGALVMRLFDGGARDGLVTGASLGFASAISAYLVLASLARMRARRSAARATRRRSE